MNRIYKVLIVFIALGLNALSAQSNGRVITTGVPFLLISPDARSAGMGELGVATSRCVFATMESCEICFF